MRHRYSAYFFPIQLVIDLIVLNTAFLSALWIRFVFIAHGTLPVSKLHYTIFWLVYNLLWIILVLLTKPYTHSRHNFNLNSQLARFFRIAILHLVLVIAFWVFIKGYYYSRGHLILSSGILVFAGILWRIVATYLIKRYRISGYNKRNYIIVGYGELSDTVKNYYEMNPDIGYTFKGYFDKDTIAPNVKSWHHNLAGMEEYILDERIDLIYCCQPYLENKDIQEIIQLGEKHKIKIMVQIDFRGFLTNEATLEYHDFIPVINISTKAFSNVRREVLKRIFDLVFSLLVVTLGFPVFLIIGLLVKLTSKGPIFFLQERSGRWGEPFKIIKFRSMVPNSDRIAQKHSMGDGDLRITKFGSFLRKTRLDELPQFFNVIAGDMSIVGPRPLARYDVDMLMKESPNKFKRVLTIKPGITSIGQVKVGYADNAQESVKRLNYDLIYVENPSLRTDIWLIARTVLLVFQKKGK
jgi:exopolysaccharide biosynthesis polyprenyl glycosylphosphotransferase